MNFNRKLFNTTDTELKAIAALANIGFTITIFMLSAAEEIKITGT